MAGNTLNDFISLVKTKGLAVSNKFGVLFTPVGGYTSSNLDLQSLLLFCHGINVPGINISTNPGKIFAETFEFAYEKLYGPITLTFYVDTNLEVKKIFDSWFEKIQDPTTKKFSYYDDYITDLELFIYNHHNEKVYSMKFYDAYPKTMSDIQLDYSANGLMTLQVTFTYRYFDTSSNYGISQSSSNYNSALSGQIINLAKQNISSSNLSVASDYFTNFSSFQQSSSNLISRASNSAKEAVSSSLSKLKDLI